jgi:hypothetical protein
VWRHLPGPIPVRVLLALVLALVVVTVLFVWVFPWLEPRLPFTGVTVQDSSATVVRTLGR